MLFMWPKTSKSCSPTEDRSSKCCVLYSLWSAVAGRCIRWVFLAVGFDTATEIGLLGISAAERTRGMSVWSILVFLALFTAGTSLIDAADNILMIGVYGRAFVKPVRKLYYNMTIAVVSALVALLVGELRHWD